MNDSATPMAMGPEPQEPAVSRLTRDDHARRRFLKMVGSGGAGAFALLAAAYGSTSAAAAPPPASSKSATAAAGGDLAIVNYALTLEYVEAEFYAKAIDSGIFKNTRFAKYSDVLKRFGHQENEHVVALKHVAKTLGTPAAKPTTDFSKVFAKGPAAVAGLAANVENLGAAAYLGQAPRIHSREILAAALSIHTVEARHAAALNLVVGNGITGKAAAHKAGGKPPAKYFGILPTGAFADPDTMATVLALAGQFIVKS